MINVEEEEEKVYKEYVICLRNKESAYTFKVKNLKILNDIYEIIKEYQIGDFDNMKDLYEF